MPGNRRGLVYAKNLGGHVHPKMGRYPVSADNPTRIFIGDPVFMTASGVIRVIDVSGVSAQERPPVGVVAAIADSNEKPLTHNLPGTGQFLAASTAGFVDLYDDPDALFVAALDATATQNTIGQFVRVTAGSANTAVGRSGFAVKFAEATGSSIGHFFRIVDMAPSAYLQGRTGGGQFGGNQDVLLQIADHHYRHQYNRLKEGN